MNEIYKYIEFRLPNWLQAAEFLARVHGFQGWEHDLLNDVLTDLLQKDPAKLKDLLSRKTEKKVNGAHTTELDKFVLRMLKLNAFSENAPFRKNTLGYKIIERPADGAPVVTASIVEFEPASMEQNHDDQEPDQARQELNDRLDEMHRRNIDRLALNEFGETGRNLYRRHFIGALPLAEFSDQEQQQIKIIERFLTIYKKTLFDD